MIISANTVNCIDTLAFLKSIKHNDSFDLVIADPPYNIGKDFGNDSDNREMSDYIRWSHEYIDECFRLVKSSAPIYIYGLPEIMAHIAVKYPIQNQRWLTWHYTNKTVPSSKFWQRSFESILCLWKGKKPTLDIDAIREEYTEGFIKNAAGKVRNSKSCRYSKGNSKTIYNAHEKGALPRDVIRIPALAGGAGYSERMFYCKSCKTLCSQSEKHKHDECDVIKHPTQKPLKLTEKIYGCLSP